MDEISLGMWLVERKSHLWQLSSAEPAWKWDSQRSWPEAFFTLGSAFRSALRVANFQIKKIILKESLWDQGIGNLEPSSCRIYWAIAQSIQQGKGFEISRQDRTLEVNKGFQYAICLFSLAGLLQSVGIAWIVDEARGHLATSLPVPASFCSLFSWILV